jgi:hypothetical protein
MPVLAARQRPVRRLDAVLALEGLDGGRQAGDAALRQCRRVQDRVEPIVVGIVGMRRAVVEEVAVEVDVVLVHPPQPGEAVWVEGVHQHQRDAGRPAGGEAVVEQEALDAGAAQPLDAVRTRGNQQHPRCVGRAEPGDVEEQRRTVGAGQRMAMGVNLGAGRRGGGEEVGAGGGGVGGKRRPETLHRRGAEARRSDE